MERGVIVSRKIYNKLIRDKIPKIIDENNKVYNIEIMNDEEYKNKINQKILEEVQELLESKTHEERVNELADTYEILEAYMAANNIDAREVEVKKDSKLLSRGGFKGKILLIDVGE